MLKWVYVTESIDTWYNAMRWLYMYIYTLQSSIIYIRHYELPLTLQHPYNSPNYVVDYNIYVQITYGLNIPSICVVMFQKLWLPQTRERNLFLIDTKDKGTTDGTNRMTYKWPSPQLARIKMCSMEAQGTHDRDTLFLIVKSKSCIFDISFNEKECIRYMYTTYIHC